MTPRDLAEMIINKYDANLDFPWENDNACVFCNQENKKWFAILMFVPEKYIRKTGEEMIPILNVKVMNISESINETGIFPAYHMSKNHWVSLDLREINDKKIKRLIDISFNLTLPQIRQGNEV